MRRISIYGLLACLFSIIGTGCTQDENISPSNTLDKIIITGSIENASYMVQSRVGQDIFDSYKSGGFTKGDEVGFYSQYNNEGEETSPYPFSNLRLTYQNDGEYQSFENEALGNTPSNLGNVFAYYPYSEDNKDNQINIYNTDGSLIDLLTATSTGLGTGGLIHFYFQHAFSMLFIFPGDGFKQAMEKDEPVTVVLENGISHATISEDRRTFSLVPCEETEEHREFTAKPNRGVESDREPDEGDIIFGNEPPAANTLFYVLLPSGTKVDYIEITDDFDKKHRVYPTEEKLPTLARNMRYPITIQMEGDEPTIWPCEFTDWIQENPIVDNRQAGISEISQLQRWIELYNSYCTSDNPETYKEQLDDFGDYKTDHWEFYLNADLNCSDLNISNHLIFTFKDVFDGRNHTLSNLKLTGESAGFINTLSGGCVKNLKLENASYTSTLTDAAIGGIVNTMENGVIENCKVSNLRIETKGPVGAITGSISQGTIQNNTCGGILIGTESDEAKNYLIGSSQEKITFTGNATTNLIFQQINPTE